MRMWKKYISVQKVHIVVDNLWISCMVFLLLKRFKKLREELYLDGCCVIVIVVLGNFFEDLREK